MDDNLIPVLIIVLPIALIIGLTAYKALLRHRQVQQLLDERRLLIEKGITDLPPPEVPEMMRITDPPPPQVPEMLRKRDPLRSLKAGIILLALAAAFLVGYFLFPEDVSDPHYSVFLGALGLALILIHYIAQAYERREKNENGE